jgi:hypothetical protein
MAVVVVKKKLKSFVRLLYGMVAIYFVVPRTGTYATVWYSSVQRDALAGRTLYAWYGTVRRAKLKEFSREVVLRTYVGT